MYEHARSKRGRVLRERMMIAVIALLGGCTTPRPVVISGADPADSGAIVVQPTPAAVTAGNGVAFPVLPRPWDEVNRRVAPGAGKSP